MKTRKSIKLLWAAVLLIALVAGTTPAAALNFNGGGTGSGSGNKALNLNGYKFTNASRTTLYLYFDKTLDSAQLDVSQFKVKEHSSATTVSVSSLSLATGTGQSGCSDSQLDNGSTVTLTLASSLSYDTQYDITLSPTIAANNAITLGNYHDHQDLVFVLKTPNSSGAYTGTPTVTFLTSTAWESNPVVVLDRPATGISTLLSNLSTNFKKSGTTVTQDSTIDGTAVSGAESYTPHANNEGNTLFFPLTAKGSTNIAYNLAQSSNSYTLTVPNFTDVSGNSYSSGGSASFTTVSSDVVGWTDSVPSASYDDLTGTLTITWSNNSNTSVTPAPGNYNIYYSASKFGLNGDWTLLGSQSGSSPFTYTQSSLLPSGTIYFRVVPKDGSGNQVGYSLPTTTSVTLP